jgi:hypothetical protein
MLEDSVVESPPARCGYAGSPSLSTWGAASASAAWVHVAGELDFTASLQLTQTSGDAQPGARLVVLDQREFTTCVT